MAYLSNVSFFIRLSVFDPRGVLHRGPSSEGAGLRGEALGQAAVGEQRQRGHPVVLRLPTLPRALSADEDPAGRAQPAGRFLVIFLVIFVIWWCSL